MSQHRIPRGRNVAPGYVLDLDPLGHDVGRFEALVERGRRRLAEGAADDAVVCFDEALGQWAGDALAEFDEASSVVAAATRLEELRATVTEDRFDALLSTGRDVDLVSDLQVAIATMPFRERRRGQSMLALYRAGR